MGHADLHWTTPEAATDSHWTDRRKILDGMFGMTTAILWWYTGHSSCAMRRFRQRLMN